MCGDTFLHPPPPRYTLIMTAPLVPCNAIYKHRDQRLGYGRDPVCQETTLQDYIL